MTKGLSGLRALFGRLFPERQFYHRSHGEVHFVSLSGRTQLVYVGLTLGFLTWVGYASVNVVFKEQIITEKERKFVRMEKRYEQTIDDLEAAYDEVNSVLVMAEQRFQDSTRQLERRHRQLETLVEQRQALNNLFDGKKTTYLAKNRNQQKEAPGENVVLMRVTELEPTARRSRLIEQEEVSAVSAVTAAVGRMLANSLKEQDKRSDLMERVAAVDKRVLDLKKKQETLVLDLEERSQNRAAFARETIIATGLDIDAVVKRFDDVATAEGGPLISLDESDLIATENHDTDSDFKRHVFRLANQIQELTTLEYALAGTPLINPVNAKVNRTSGYGPRRDPFTKRRAFHSGIDISGTRGSPVVASVPGVVTYAGPKGPYGNLVEIDHGHGFKTRYGHLQKILVKRGQKVDFYDKIALLGNTGRSTGPHLHYEIWFNNKVKDPEKFFEAGKHVFKE